jgi:hypothetical protein
MNYVVGEVKRDGIEREIRVHDVFAEDGVAVSVTAGENGCPIGVNSEDHHPQRGDSSPCRLGIRGQAGAKRQWFSRAGPQR